MAVMLNGKSLKEARREIEALQPGETWSTDHPVTMEEFNRLTPDGTHAELFEGVIYMPSPSDEHEVVFGFLYRLLGDYVHELDLGEVRGSRSGVRLDLFSAPQPDLLFVRKSRRHIIHRLEIVEPPDMIMEIVFSERSRQRAHAKMIRYEKFGVPEFWYIDLPLQRARLYHLNRAGRYTVSFEGNKGLVRSRAVRGFAIRAEWLWSKPGKFPSVIQVVRKLLAK